MTELIVDKTTPDELPKGYQYPARPGDVIACFENLPIKAKRLGMCVYQTIGSSLRRGIYANRYSLCRLSHYPEPSRTARRPWDELDDVVECDLWLDAIPERIARSVRLTPRALPEVLKRNLAALTEAIDAGMWFSVGVELVVKSEEIVCEQTGRRAAGLPEATSDSTYRIADL